MTVRARDMLDAKGREVITVEPGASLEDAIETLAQHGIGAVLVVEGRDVRGVVSERDVVRVLAGAPTGFRETPVLEVMTTPVHTAGPDDTVDELLDQMTMRRVRHLPVCEEGHLTGILSIGDVVKHRIRAVTSEADMLRDYIQG